MAKYTLKVSKSWFKSLPEAFAISSCQALSFYYSTLAFDEFKFINCYKYCYRINLIKISFQSNYQDDDGDSNLETMPIFIQSILFNFTSLNELHLNLNNFELDDKLNLNIKLVSSNFSNLHKLTIISMNRQPDDVS